MHLTNNPIIQTTKYNPISTVLREILMTSQTWCYICYIQFSYTSSRKTLGRSKSISKHMKSPMSVINLDAYKNPSCNTLCKSCHFSIFGLNKWNLATKLTCPCEIPCTISVVDAVEANTKRSGHWVHSVQLE